MKPHILLLLLAGLGASLGACSAERGASGERAGTEAAQAKGEHEEHSEGDKHEGEEHDAGPIELTDEQVSKAGLELLTAEPRAIREQVMLYGTIVPNAERVREVGARFPGVIQSVAKKVGDSVKQGDQLAIIESNESLRTYSINAPISGVVTERSAYEGEQAGEKPLFTVADLTTVWAEIALFPRDLGKIREGQEVQVTSSDGGVRADGKLVYVAPLGSRANQTVSARVLLDNHKQQWAPGLYVTAHVAASETQADLAVRNTAIQTMNDKTVVFVKAEHGFEAREVRLGQRDSQWTQVLEGLQPGEQYVAKNSFILKAELGKGSLEHED